MSDLLRSPETIAPPPPKIRPISPIDRIIRLFNPPLIRVEPQEYPVGPQEITPFTIFNDGKQGSQLEIYTIETQGAGFLVDSGGMPIVIPPGKPLTLAARNSFVCDVRFNSPSTLGLVRRWHGKLNIEHNTLRRLIPGVMITRVDLTAITIAPGLVSLIPGKVYLNVNVMDPQPVEEEVWIYNDTPSLIEILKAEIVPSSCAGGIFSCHLKGGSNDLDRREMYRSILVRFDVDPNARPPASLEQDIATAALMVDYRCLAVDGTRMQKQAQAEIHVQMK